MDVAPCITLQSDMANLFDQYLFKDHNYEHTPPASSNLLMASQGYNSMSQFGEEDLNFQGLQLPPQQNNNNTLMATTASPSTISETDHSLADIFTSPILTSMSHQDGPEQTSSQYNDYHNPSEASYVSSQRYDTQPIYTTSELKPVLNRAQTHSQKQQQTLLNLGQPTEKLGMTSPQHLPPQPPIYQALNQGHPISTTANQIVSVTQQQRYNSADRRPSSTGSASIGSSPAESIHTSPGRESEDSDDSVPISQVNGVFPLPNGLGVKRRSPEPDDNIPSSTAKTKVAKKPKVQKKKKKRDPNEPQKPVSAYALFFRDTQAAIKGQNPNASFGEVSKIVASMWDGLDVEHKNVYKKKTEAAKKEYLKALAAYRASIVCRTGPEHDLNMNNSSMMGNRHPQTMTALQKKSPLLTSLMDNSSSNSHQQYSSAAVYSSSKLMTSTPSIEPYPTYQPPMYKPPSANMAPYHPPPNMPHNSYPHPPVNKNMMNSSMPGQNMMDMVPANSSSPVIGMDPSVPQHPHPALINMQPGTVIGSSLPQHMPTSVTSANHFNKIQDEQCKYSYNKQWNPASSQFLPSNNRTPARVIYTPGSTNAGTTGHHLHDPTIRTSDSRDYGSYTTTNGNQSGFNTHYNPATGVGNGSSQYSNCSSISQSYYKQPAGSGGSEFISSEASVPEGGLLQSRC